MEKRKTISVIVPAYNEQEVLEVCWERVDTVFKSLDYELELIFINDGSRDSTLEVLGTLAQRDPRVLVIDLSRNFGKEIAVSAGLDHATGDAAVIIDADLQDPPELIGEFIKWWEQGYDNIYGKRTVREGETWVKKATASAFYKIVGRMSRIEIPENTGDFRLISRRVIDALKELREHHRFMKGLFAWVGFSTKAIEYRRSPRFAGTTKWNYWGLWNFAIEGITSFSTAPLKAATYAGGLISFGAFAFAGIILVKTVIYGIDVPGYASQMIITLLLGGVNLAALGVIGEYLGRMFNETKKRPLYFVNRTIRQSETVSLPLPSLRKEEGSPIRTG